MRSTETNASGEFSLGELPPGSYRLEFKKASASWFVERVLVCPDTFSVVDARDPRTRSRLEGEAMGHLPRNPLPPPDGYRRNSQGLAGIYGQIRTPDLQGVAGARVAAESAAHGRSEATTDAQGNYELKNLAPGAYRIAITGSLLATEAVPKADVLAGLELRLDRDVCRR